MSGDRKPDAWGEALEAQYRAAIAMDSTLDADRICELVNAAHLRLDDAYQAEPQTSVEWRMAYSIVESALRRWRRRELLRSVNACIEAAQAGMAAALARIPEMFP